MEYKIYLIICSILTILTVSKSIPNLPSFLKICHRSDPNLSACIMNSVEQLRPLLARGIPEFGIPSCEPLYIPEVGIEQGTGAVAIRSSYTDIKVYGPSDFQLKSVKLDMDKDRARIKLWLPHLEMISNYTLEGRILMMPISGKGRSIGNYSNIDATVTMQAERVIKDNQTYFNVKDFFVDFSIGHATIQLTDLFNGDKELGEAMNMFLNENWRSVANEIKPVLEETIADIFKKFSNRIYHKYPINVLLPP